MPVDPLPELKKRIADALADEGRRKRLFSAMKRGRDGRKNTLHSELARMKGFQEDVRERKVRCLKKNDELIAKFTESASKRGTKVHMAETGEGAIATVLDILKKAGAKTVAKSKSLTSEELHINPEMEKAGLEVVETDLGELIIQKAGEKPYHLVFPAVHKTAQDVSEIFTKALGRPVPDDPPEIMRIIRTHLRPIFLNADVGMTGANFAIAETGMIAIQTNEGNARMVSTIPDIHICIMGIEKIVETIEDALKLILAPPVSANGQILTSYTSLLGGRAPMGEGEPARKPREAHIILLDNGRRKMRDDPVLFDALHCVRCGACMNVCPTYGVVGGHTFGYIYPGAMGIPWTTGVHGLEKAGAFSSLCVSCGLCKEVCPAKIDLPLMIAEVKDRFHRDVPPPSVEKMLMAAEPFSKTGCAFAPLSNWFLRNPLVRWFMEKTSGISRKRELPPFARPTFVKRFKKRTPPARTGEPKRKVAYFYDLFANYNAPELGMAAVEALEAAGCEVIVPDQKASGFPYIGYGCMDKARRAAEVNSALLAPVVEQGYDIVASEPTATQTLRDYYPKLLPDSTAAAAVGAKTFEIFEYLMGMDAPRPDLKGKRFGFHVPCHQRPLGAGEGAMNWLRACGAEVELRESGTCCGMAGTFGMKAGPLGIDLSRAVGEPLFEEFQESGVETIVTESSVCAMHLRDGTGLKVVHPLELLKKP